MAQTPVTEPANKLRAETVINIGVSVSSLFDMREADKIFREQGEAAFEAHIERLLADYKAGKIPTPFEPGPAFAFAHKLAALNTHKNVLVNFTVLSRNHHQVSTSVRYAMIESGLVFADTESRQGVGSAYTKGEPITRDMLEDFGVDLFLSTHLDDVQSALRAGHAAAYVDPEAIDQPDRKYNHSDKIVMVFDCDRVLLNFFGDDGYPHDREQYFKDHGHDIAKFEQREHDLIDIPGETTAFTTLLHKLIALRERLKQMESAIRFELVLMTAATVAGYDRAEHTFQTMGIRVDKAYSTGTPSKANHLATLGADLFIDDGLERNIQPANRVTLAVWAPDVVDRTEPQPNPRTPASDAALTPSPTAPILTKQ